MTSKKYKSEVNRRGGARLVAALLRCNEANVRKRMSGAVAVDREAAAALDSLPLVERVELTADDYVQAVNARGGAAVVARALGLHVTNVNRRMAGTHSVGHEAMVALAGVPLAREPHKWTRGRRPKWAGAAKSPKTSAKAA